MLETSSFSSIVSRLFLGVVLTKVFLIPYISFCTIVFDRSLSENNDLNIIKPITKEVNTIALFILDANTKFSNHIDVVEWSKNPINLEKVISYLIYLSLVWESPIVLSNFLISFLLKCKHVKINQIWKRIELREAKFLIPAHTVVWKQSPNKTQEITFPISKELGSIKQVD